MKAIWIIVEQIVFAIEQSALGTKVEEICRRSVLFPSFYLGGQACLQRRLNCSGINFLMTPNPAVDRLQSLGSKKCFLCG